MQALFGGSKSEQESQYTSRAVSKEKSKSKTIDVTPNEYKGLRPEVSDALTKLLSGDTAGIAKLVNGMGTGAPGGELVAGIGANEQALLSKLMNDPLTAERQALLKKTLGGDFLPGQGGSNPYLDEAIRAAQRGTKNTLIEALERALPGRFTQAGHFTQPRGSSAFDRAAAVATGETAAALGDIATQISFGGYEAERNRQQEAISLSQQEVDTTIKNLEAQALPRLIKDLGIQRGLETFNARIESLLSALGLAGQFSLQFGTKSKAKGKSKSVSQGTSSGESSSSNGIFPSLFSGL